MRILANFQCQREFELVMFDSVACVRISLLQSRYRDSQFEFLVNAAIRSKLAFWSGDKMYAII
jgi:hypothetical protein